MTPCSRKASGPQRGVGGSVEVEALSQTWTTSAGESVSSLLRCSSAGRSASAIAPPANRTRTAWPAMSRQTSSQPPTEPAASSEIPASCSTSRARSSALPGVKATLSGSGLTGPAGLVDFMNRVEEQELLHVGVRAQLRRDVRLYRCVAVLPGGLIGDRAVSVLGRLLGLDDKLLIGEPADQVVDDTGRFIALQVVGRGERGDDVIGVGAAHDRVPDEAPGLVEGVVGPVLQVDDGGLTVECLRHHVRAVDSVSLGRHVPSPSICRRLRAATLAIVVPSATLGDALIRVAGDAASPSSRDCRRPPHISRFGLRPSLQSGAAWQPLGLYFLKL